MMKFKDSQGNVVPITNIPVLLGDDKSQYEIFVGTDSKVKKKLKKVVYVTCIVLYKKGKGGRILTHRERKNIPVSLKERLGIEVWNSIETSLELSKILPDIPISVHIDVNQSPKYKSGNFSQELAAMVVGQGFKCMMKPDAFAAQSVADRFSKKGD